MRLAFAFGLMMGASVLLTGQPAVAANAPALGADRLAVAGHSDVQKVWWRWHGRRWEHRRWERRHFDGRVWLPGHWVYY